MKALFAAAILSAATASQAQDRPQFSEFLGSLDGSEVTMRTDIGYSRGNYLRLVMDGMYHNIPAQAALTRDQLASLDDCDVDNYETHCTANILAELTFSDGRISATIFDVKT